MEAPLELARFSFMRARLFLLAAGIPLAACTRSTPTIEKDPAPPPPATASASAEVSPFEPAPAETAASVVAPRAEADPEPEIPEIDWAKVRVCPRPPGGGGCSPPGKHCDCVSYGILASSQIRRDWDSASDEVRACLGIMNHAPCPENGVYRECSRATRAKGLTPAERRFFACAAQFCDGRY